MATLQQMVDILPALAVNESLTLITEMEKSPLHSDLKF